VLLFGPQARDAGRREVALELSDTPTVTDVLRQLAQAEPSLKSSLATSRLAVNHKFADAAARVEATDELALIGLISGG
jgi:molybdopterin converting factor small subunit